MSNKRRLYIRNDTYRGQNGFVLRGTETDARGVRHPLCSIFVRRRETAEAIRDVYRAGKDGETEQREIGKLILGE